MDRLRAMARSGLSRARAGFGHARAFAIRTWNRGRIRARAAWVSFRDSWTKTDWMAGMEPLPPGMASILAAIGIVAGLVVTSLLYADHHGRLVMDARMIASGEHPSQQQAPSPDTEPVPIPATPAPSASLDLPQTGEAFTERFDRDSIEDRWRIADGWSNGKWMSNDWRKTSVEVRPDLLTLHLRPGPAGSEYALASGEVQTHTAHRYGYFEVRMKVPRGPGLVTGMFTYAGRQGRTRPNEIDIEILGRSTRVAELTIHEGGKATSRKLTLPFDAADGFHTYGFDWQPDHVRWYIDGVLAHAETGPAARNLTRPQQLMINLWASRELRAWVGDLDMREAPWRLEISCIAYRPVYAGRICA